jgi:hypothetical protein
MALPLRFLIPMLLLPIAFACSGRNQAVALAEDDQPRCVIFFEGTDCDPAQGRSSCCTEASSDMGGCWTNDEAQSMKVYGGPGTVVTAFDHPDAETQDDYFVLRKKDSSPICVGSFDHARGRFDPPSRSSWFYSGGNGLDGKVSTFRWYDPRQIDASGRQVDAGIAAR